MDGESPPHSPTMYPEGRRRRGRSSLINRIERCCCVTLAHIPLVFVYSITTWAVWAEAQIGLEERKKLTWLGIILYVLLNWSYTTAVFRDPGSPLVGDSRNGYSHLPTTDPSAITVKATGEVRFCKKCRCRKPDRAHHCSTCKRCVLKMDHHCPWLATCVGLKNYKPFLLFLIYTSLFCWACFAMSAGWVYGQVINDKPFDDAFMPIQYVLLAVISGIFGIVITAFTTWHVLLSMSGQTTIERLEKTRYLNPVMKTWQQHHRPGTSAGSTHDSIGQQLLEIHANAIPGVTRPEEGLEHSPVPSDQQHTPAAEALRNSYAADDIARQRQRYAAYLDEDASAKLPFAFDLGWKRNMLNLLGPKWYYWFLPICNSVGDGWSWETSQTWRDAREQAQREIRARLHSSGAAPDTQWIEQRHYLDHQQQSSAQQRGPSPSKADRVLGRVSPMNDVARPASRSRRGPEDDYEQGQFDDTDEEGGDDPRAWRRK